MRFAARFFPACRTCSGLELALGIHGCAREQREVFSVDGVRTHRNLFVVPTLRAPRIGQSTIAIRQGEMREDGGTSRRSAMNDLVRDRIRELELKHRNLDDAVTRLGRRAYLTPVEQREFAELKKRKLMTKDQLTLLRR